MYNTYATKNNETIDTIAKKFNTTPEVLNQLNGYIADIVPGMNLIVPKVTSKYFDYYTVSKGDTLYKIAEEKNLDPNLLAELNGINKDDYIYPNQVLLIPRPGSILYFTATGDTLNEIATGLGTTVKELLEQNEKIYLQPEQLIVFKY